MAADKLKNVLLRGDLTFFASIIVVIVLPVYVHYLPPVMILWGLFWLWENKFKLSRKMFQGNKAGILFLLYVCFFLWQISGLLLADSLDSGIERIFKRLSFFLFPFVLFFPGKRIVENIKILLKLFAVFTFIYIIYCLGNAFCNSLNADDGRWVFNPHPSDYDYENYFFSSRLSDPVHPSYLTMYVILSMFISLETFLARAKSAIKRGIWLLISIVFLFVVYLLSSKAGFLALTTLLPFYILCKLYKKYSKWIVVSLVLVLIAGFFAIAKTNVIINYSIEGISKERFDTTFQNDIRVMIWKSALGVIRHNLIFGVGTGDASAELKKEFLARGYSLGYYDNLNAHNQYLEVFLENGLVGLLLFLAMLGFMLFIAISERNLIYLLFIIMMIMFFFFETVLNRLAGITFFSLFSFLLIYYKTPLETQ